MSAQNVVAAVQVQVAPKPGDNLSKAVAETEVIAAMLGLRPGENLFREKKRDPPKPKESQESKVLTKLKMFTKKDQELMLARFADMLGLLTLDIVKRRGEMGQEKKVKKAMEKAAGKKAAEEAKAAAGPKVEMPTAAGHKEEADEPEPQIEEPDVKGVAAESDVTSPVPEEPLPQIAEPKEAEAIVAAVVELDVVVKEVDRLKLETERLIKVQVDRQWNGFLKHLDGFQGHQKVQYERLRDDLLERLERLEMLTPGSHIRYVSRPGHTGNPGKSRDASSYMYHD